MKASDRLKESRIQAGYENAADFAREHGFTETTFRSHENGNRDLTIPAARSYAQHLNVTWQWLMFGEEEAALQKVFIGEIREDLDRKPNNPRKGMVIIDEVNVTGGMASGGRVQASQEGYAEERVIAQWQMPANVIRSYTAAPQERIKIITAIGDSNIPEFMPGERIMVDTTDQSPSPGGFFAMWDGFGEIIKRLEMVPYSDPPRVIVKSANKEYEQRELLLDDCIINGRVIGKWKWT